MEGSWDPRSVETQTELLGSPHRVFRPSPSPLPDPTPPTTRPNVSCRLGWSVGRKGNCNVPRRTGTPSPTELPLLLVPLLSFVHLVSLPLSLIHCRISLSDFIFHIFQVGPVFDLLDLLRVRRPSVSPPWSRCPLPSHHVIRLGSRYPYTTPRESPTRGVRPRVGRCLRLYHQ